MRRMIPSWIQPSAPRTQDDSMMTTLLAAATSINFWFDMPFAIKPLLSLFENRVLLNPLIYHNNNHHHLNIKMAIWGYGMPHVHNQISPQVGYIVLCIHTYIYISREFP